MEQTFTSIVILSLGLFLSLIYIGVLFNKNSRLKSEINDMKNVVDEKVKQLVELCSKTYNSVLLSITGSGDAFASITYWNYLLELSTNGIPSNVRLNILTNGVLMTENNWNSIKPLLSSIRQIEVSVDAATEPTYKIVRKNGNFKKLCQTLA